MYSLTSYNNIDIFVPMHPYKFDIGYKAPYIEDEHMGSDSVGVMSYRCDWVADHKQHHAI